jgi:hypothetical protein
MVNYIPIITTLFSIYFLSKIIPHYYRKPKAYYLLWWMLGVLTFGLGTLSESIHAIWGWSEWNVKYWYIVGALLGGYPLAQGTIYLLMGKTFAHLSTLVCSLIIVIASVCVVLSPIEIPEGFDYRLTGRVFDWAWVRLFSPLLNLYSLVFLLGGAIYSAVQYAKLGKNNPRFLGNIFIAIGALLPGIGGTYTRFGHVEVLFITELLGLVSIYIGYEMMRNDPSLSLHTNQTSTA